MPEQTPVTLNLFALYQFTDSFFQLSTQERKKIHHRFLSELRTASECVEIYQVFPLQAQADILVWQALPVSNPADSARFFTLTAKSISPLRQYITPLETLWGFTRPSQYTKTRSTQEIDPFSSSRQPYLVVYPFVKTHDWYRLSREARQGVMNEHIRIGKDYPEITQLLLYSFGLQDQEFVVVYEAPDLIQFSNLVNSLRDTEGRRFTKRDTPNITAVYHPAEETLALWE